jgi:hypothetical protein
MTADVQSSFLMYYALTRSDGMVAAGTLAGKAALPNASC